LSVFQARPVQGSIAGVNLQAIQGNKHSSTSVINLAEDARALLGVLATSGIVREIFLLAGHILE